MTSRETSSQWSNLANVGNKYTENAAVINCKYASEILLIPCHKPTSLILRASDNQLRNKM